MGKDLEWMKEWIEKYENKIIEELGKEPTSNHLTTRLHGGLSALKEINHRINQLDEPEVLSQEWIDDVKMSGELICEDEYAYRNVWFVPEEKLQGLLVPKQETSEQTDIDVGLLKERVKALEKYNEELIRDNNQLRSAMDNKEVLTPDWIDKHEYEVREDNVYGQELRKKVVSAGALQHLLVPKQEEVDQAYKDGYEKGKEHAGGKEAEETETVASVFVNFLRASAKLKLALGMEVEELEE